MPLSSGLRGSGRRINLHSVPTSSRAREARHFSHCSSTPRPSQTSNIRLRHIRSAQQSRSLSAWGWGADAQAKAAAEFSKSHQTTTESSSSLETASPFPSPAAPQSEIESTRTVKATHATSDAPDPASINTSDPLQAVEDSILAAKGTTATEDAIELASIPEGIGYLKDACGLDYGWGPTALAEFIVEHMHITAGLSWSASIIAMAVVIRVAIFPLFVSAGDMSARFQELGPVMKELKKESEIAERNNDKAASVSAQMQLRELMKDSKVSWFKMFRPLVFQAPLGYGAWHFLGQASYLPVPGFEAEHWLWLDSIATGDPWYILPVLAGGMTYLNLRVQSSSNGTASGMAGPASVMRKVFPIISFAFLCFQPGSVQIYFLTNNMMTQFQVSSFANPAMRKLFRMHPLPLKKPTPQPGDVNSMGNSQMRFAPRVVDARGRTRTIDSTPTPDKPAPSIIDRGVDAVKNRWFKIKEQRDGVMESMVGKKSDRTRDDKKASADRHEAERRLEIDRARIRHNQTAMQRKARPGSASNPSGGLNP